MVDLFTYQGTECMGLQSVFYDMKLKCNANLPILLQLIMCGPTKTEKQKLEEEQR